MPNQIEQLKKIHSFDTAKRELDAFIKAAGEKLENAKAKNIQDMVNKTIESLNQKYGIGKSAIKLYLSMDKKLFPMLREGGRPIFESRLSPSSLESGKNIRLASKINGATIEILYAIDELKEFREELEGISYLFPESTKCYFDKKRIERENETEPTPIRDAFEAKVFETAWKKMSTKELEDTFKTIMKLENDTDIATTISAFLKATKGLGDPRATETKALKENAMKKLFYHTKRAVEQGGETPPGLAEHRRVKEIYEKSPELVKLLLEGADFRNIQPEFALFIQQCSSKKGDIEESEKLYRRYLGNKLSQPPIVFANLTKDEQNSIVEISKNQTYRKHPRLEKQPKNREKNPFKQRF